MGLNTAGLAEPPELAAPPGRGPQGARVEDEPTRFCLQVLSS